MIKWAEVIQPGSGIGNPPVKLAALIVSDETDGGLATMVSLKASYGADKIYRWHYCEHDDGGSCKTESA